MLHTILYIFSPLEVILSPLFGTRYEIRTRVLAVKGRYPRPLDEPSINFGTRGGIRTRKL